MLSLVCLAAMARQSETYPQTLVGKAAPKLVFEQVLKNGKATVTQASLKGKVTLLEFWFVNCGACRQAVPHVNRLVRKFSPKGLQSFAVTFDSADAAKKYLEEVPLTSPIGIDTKRRTINAYGVTAFPTTFLIGRDGKVISVTGPDSITEKVLVDALAGRPVKIAPVESQWKPEAEPVTKASEKETFTVSVSNRKGSSYSVRPEKVSFLGVSLRQAVQYLYRLTPNQFDMKLQPDENLYDLEAIVPNGKDHAAETMMKSRLESKFHLTVRTEMRDQKVAVFRKSGPLKGLTPYVSGPRGATGDNFTGSPLSSIVDSVAFMMGVIGIDETHDNGLYNFSMAFKTSPSYEEQVKEMYGLDIQRETRKMPFTIVRQAKS